MKVTVVDISNNKGMVLMKVTVVDISNTMQQ